jgi:glutamate synthase (NADPH/NADH) small chain
MSSESDFRKIGRSSRVNQEPVPYFKRDVAERIRDFEEVILGYDDEFAQDEASRCMQCPDPQPCVLSCPAGNNVPEALWLASQGKFVEAGLVFAASSPLPEVCGRVCPNICQQGCTLGKRHGAVSVGKLEAFVSDMAREAGLLAIKVPDTKTGKHIAVVGSGPAGITVAEEMVKLGHDVTVYESWPEPGGVLVYGIPAFKLDKEIVGYKIQDLRDVGVKFITNTRIGKDIMIEELQESYDAVFLGTGAGIEATMNIPGEDLKGVWKSTDYLVRANVKENHRPEDKKEVPVVGNRVAVIGGGDSAVDCARSSVRLGAQEVTIVYRRTEAEMPGNQTERYTCLEEGVKINYLQAPIEYIGDENGRVKAMKVIKMKLGEPDASGRRRPIKIEGSEFIQEVDTVILAVGYWPDPLLGEKTDNLATHKWGLILADETVGATTRVGVFAAGDNVHGPDLVITAIASAQQAARSMANYLEGQPIELPKPKPRKKR